MLMSRIAQMFRFAAPVAQAEPAVVELTPLETEQVAGGSPKGGWELPGDGTVLATLPDLGDSPKGGW